jgi:hypothetical protein
MPLRGSALPRMAGHLPFMRGPVSTLDRVQPGQIAVFGAGVGAGLQDASLGPLGLRETSSYFGSHFASNMKAAMDIDQRRILDSAAVAGRIVDLGDIDFTRSSADPSDSVMLMSSAVCRRGAIPMMLGGTSRLADPMRRGIEMGSGHSVAVAPMDFSAPPADGIAMLVIVDAATVASTWHGASPRAQSSGLSLSEMRRRLRELGTAPLAGIAVTGIEPMRAGLSTVKTAQRLLVTAVLDLIYAHLDALLPKGTTNGR